MAQTLADLEAEGLIDRSPDASDRRQVLVRITELGEAALAEDRARRDGWLARAIASELTPEEQDLLIDAVPLLRRLADIEQ
jgi:DNA-binding MarR family transcriptional regulator